MSESKQSEVKAAHKRIAAEMYANDRYKSFFDQYQEDSVKAFVDYYANRKAHLEVYGDITKTQQEHVIVSYHKDAWARLVEIQHKKLFDIECQWRAEEISGLPDIEITKDFSEVAESVLDYEGLPPITTDEIEHYQTYLRIPQAVVYYCSFRPHYPDYGQLKDRYSKHSDTEIEYFDFHNLHTGNDTLLLLPDIREQKELEYINFGKGNTDESDNEKSESEPKQADKPYLSLYGNESIEFAERFGDKKMANFLREWDYWMQEKPDEIFDWAFLYLKDCYRDEIPIMANQDWKEGLYLAAINHHNNQVADLLPTIHQEYLMKKELGMPVIADKNKFQGFKVSDIWKEAILRGRERKGEPRDFNF